MEIYPVIGLIILNTSFATQLVKILRTKRIEGISPWALAQLLVCCLLFAGYYAGNGHFLALGLNLLLMVIVISILVLYRKHTVRTQPNGQEIAFQLKDGRWVVQYRDLDNPDKYKREYFGRSTQAKLAAKARDAEISPRAFVMCCDCEFNYGDIECSDCGFYLR